MGCECGSRGQTKDDSMKKRFSVLARLSMKMEFFLNSQSDFHFGHGFLPHFVSNDSGGAKALSSKILSEGPLGQFRHFHRKFKHFKFFGHLKSREIQNLIFIFKSVLKTCCEWASLFRHLLLKKIYVCLHQSQITL